MPPSLRIPPTAAVMVAAMAGFFAGPVLLWLGAGSEMDELLDDSGPFTLWAVLIGLQTMLWILAVPPLVGILRANWKQARAEHVVLRNEVLSSLVVLVVLVAGLMYAASTNPVAEFLPHARWKVRVLTVIALAVAALASASVWVIRARLDRMREQAPTRDNLEAYVGMRAELERLLAFLGAIVGLAVLSSASMRNVVSDVLPDALGDFPPEAVIVYGLALSLVLAIVYLPTLLLARAVGAELRDRLAPFPEPATFAEGMEARQKLDGFLGLTVSATTSFRAAVAILSPLLGGLASLIPKIGGS